MMGPLVSEKIRVKIFGKEYELDPGNLTPLEASQLASYVDQKMREISEKLNIVDTQKIAVLAALNIAFELSQPSADDNALSQEDEKKLEGLAVALEKALNV